MLLQILPEDLFRFSHLAGAEILGAQGLAKGVKPSRWLVVGELVLRLHRFLPGFNGCLPVPLRRGDGRIQSESSNTQDLSCGRKPSTAVRGVLRRLGRQL